MREIYKAILDSLNEGKPIVQSTIIAESGSSPRAAGTKMLIREDGSIVGTIGGGMLEATIMAAAPQVYQSRQSLIHHFALTGKDASLSDMICGGSGAVLVQYIPADDEQIRTLYENTCEIVDKEERGWIITRMTKLTGNDVSVNLCLVDDNGKQSGNMNLTAAKAQDFISQHYMIHADSNKADKQVAHYVENVRSQYRAFIFGGGHVAREIARAAGFVDFQTTVIDDRDEYANPERFPNSKIILTDDFTKLPELPIDNESFVVITTRGHLGDYDVLKQMLGTDAGYIGMIGSRSKKKLLYERLIKEGISEEQLARIHSPIGLPIKAETPAEIAISVVAEMIQCRAEMA